MERFKRILKRMFFLPPLPTVFISIPSFAFVIYVLSAGVTGLPAYIAYAVSAYALTVCITIIPVAVRFFRYGINTHPIVRKLQSHPLGSRFMGDVRFRTEVSLYQGFFFNLIYIVMKMAAGVYYQSIWFVSLAVYYMLLAVMRFLLLHRGKRKKQREPVVEELHRYRLCGIMLLLMNQALAGMVVFMVRQNRGFDYPGSLIYLMALYSFYSVIIAVMNLIKFRKHGSPVLSAAKAVNLVAAMVSILSLETAMLARFGDDDEAFRAIMTGATGGGVCTIVIGMAVFMIVKSTKEIRCCHDSS